MVDGLHLGDPRREERLPRSDRRLISLLLAAAFVVILNETILIGALPQLMIELDLTAGAAQWLTSGFLLTMAVVIPASGRLPGP